MENENIGEYEEIKAESKIDKSSLPKNTDGAPCEPSQGDDSEELIGSDGVSDDGIAALDIAGGEPDGLPTDSDAASYDSVADSADIAGGEASEPTDGPDDTPEEITAMALAYEPRPIDDAAVSEENGTYSEEITEVENTEADTNVRNGDAQGIEDAVNEVLPRGETGGGQSRVHSLFDIVELFIICLAAVLIFTTVFARHSIVSGPSMEGTLYDGEVLIISDLFYTPSRGDIIVCQDFSTGIEIPIVKRVIAVGGDHIRISSIGEVYLNGELLDEEYVYTDGAYFMRPVDLVVPEGELFVMGDHRNMSTDSRERGTIDTDSVIGRVILRIYPFEKFTLF